MLLLLFFRIYSLSVAFVSAKVSLNFNFVKCFSIIMQDRHFTKHYDFKTHIFTFGLKFWRLILFTFIFSFYNFSTNFISNISHRFFVNLLRRILIICFLKMPVNLAHYRMTVGIFDNRQFIISLHYEGLYVRISQIICPTVVLTIPY